MVRRDPNTLDLKQQKLRIADDVMVWPVRERGQCVYRLEIPKQHRFFCVGYPEYVFISLLDGKTTIPQACGLAAARLGSRAPTAAQAGVIARWLLQNELAHLDSQPPPSRRHGGPDRRSPPSATGLLARLNPFWMKFPLPRADHAMNIAARFLQPLLDPRVLAAAIVLIVVAGTVLLTRWNELVTSSISLFHPSNWLWLLLTWVALKVVHELAHAVACVRHGGTVHEAGIVLVLLAPLAYVDVTSCWRMDCRWSRIAVASAGMFVELLIAAVAILLWTQVESVQVRFLLQNLIFAAGLSTLLFNANVLMRFDGYYILADLIEVPNLYAEASSALRWLGRRVVFGVDTGGGTLTTWRRHFVLAYGVAALLWRVSICVTLAIAASTLFAGAGIAIAALGILVWLGQPLLRLARFVTDLRVSQPHQLLRGCIVGGMIVCVFSAGLFWLPVPTSLSVPGVVRYRPETMVRSRTDGFIAKIHVRDGATVRRGQLLLELENLELRSQLRQLQITSAQNEIRMRRATDRHDAGQRQILMENQRAVATQIDQLQHQAAGLSVAAPRGGRVVARGLAARLGTYVHEGDPILLVASEADKEIITLIAQDVIQHARPLVGSQIQIRTADFRAASGTLDRVEPRADDRLVQRALGATEGGSLAVQPPSGEDDPDTLRLVEPHFRGRVALADEVARALPAGMRTTASLGFRTEPVATRMRQSIRRLWHTAQDQVSAY